jgi:hypothetical protein
MYSDSDDDSQISQPHLIDRPRSLAIKRDVKIETKGDAQDESSSRVETVDHSFSEASLDASLEMFAGSSSEAQKVSTSGRFDTIDRAHSIRLSKQQQYPSIESTFQDKEQQTSPITSMSSLQNLIAHLDHQTSPRTSPRPFISRHLQNWAVADLPPSDEPYRSASRAANEKKKSVYARSRLQFQLDDELFYKIKTLFPQLQKDRIRELLYL